jgi:hypothetical protein
MGDIISLVEGRLDIISFIAKAQFLSKFNSRFIMMLLAMGTAFSFQDCVDISVNEELRNLHSSPNIIRMKKSRRMRWAGYVARIGRSGMHIGF